MPTLGRMGVVGGANSNEPMQGWSNGLLYPLLLQCIFSHYLTQLLSLPDFSGSSNKQIILYLSSKHAKHIKRNHPRIFVHLTVYSLKIYLNKFVSSWGTVFLIKNIYLFFTVTNKYGKIYLQFIFRYIFFFFFSNI